MGNAFDFELAATDQASASIQRIEEAVKNLIPDLDKTRDGLKLGGQESTEGIDDLNTRLKGMGQFAREGVQFIGDLVPPLKMVGGLTFGLGGAATVINVVKNSLSDFASTGYRIETTAKNISMTTQAFQELTGAMIENGTERKEAESSLSGLFSQANDAAHGRNAGFLAILSQAGIGISETKEGLADVDKLVTDLNKHMQTLSPGQQALFASKLGLPPELLSLLRKTTNEVKQLKDQAQRDGLIINENDLKNAAVLKDEFNRTSAAWDGLISRMRAGTGALMAGSGTGERLKQRRSIVTTDQGKIDRMSNDDDFKSRLGYFDKLALSMGTLTDSLREKYQNEYGLKDRVEGFASDVSGMRTPPQINTPYMLTPSTPTISKSGQDALGVRNNNPGNLRVAPNATGKNGGFSTFANPQEGIAALSRQLQLYGDRGNNTLSGILHTYAPSTENNTQGYINAVSGATGSNPYERLDLHSPEVLKKLVTAIIGHENGYQPYTSEDIESGINASISDDRWKGLRNPNILLSQRQSLSSNEENEEPNAAAESITGNQPSSILTNPNNSVRNIDDITQGVGGKSEIELTLIDDKTGARRTITSPVGAKISTSMNYPS
jgi:hypothetical protein